MDISAFFGREFPGRFNGIISARILTNCCYIKYILSRLNSGCKPIIPLYNNPKLLSITINRFFHSHPEVVTLYAEVIAMVARLKQLRQAKGISQLQLADILGLSQQSINKYENHGVEPDIRTLIAMADYFGTSVDFLVGHTDLARIIEPVTPFHLNAEEAQLVECWRKLRPSEKASIHLVMENYRQKN